MSAAFAPGTPWRAIDRVEPLLAWRDGELAALAAELQRALSAWGSGWGLPPALVRMAFAPELEIATADTWQVLGNPTAAAAWVVCSDSHRAKLSQALWGATCDVSRLASEVVESCSQDLLVRLAGVLQIEGRHSSPPEAPCPPGACWSGAVAARVSCGVRIRLNAQAVRGALLRMGCARNPPSSDASGKDPLHSVRDAISTSPLALQVQLADCETDIGRVWDLQVGDVVRLPHRLDTPLLVRDTGGRTVFAGFLARKGGFKAVQLAPLAACAGTPERTLP